MIFEKNGNTFRIIQKGRQQLVYGLTTCVTGAIIAIAGLFFQQLLLAAVGTFFFITGLFMVRYVETRTTTVTTDGAVTIEYKRLLGDGLWVRRLNRTDIRSLDYVKGFDGNESIFFGHRWCTLYLNVVFDEQIEIANRYMVSWNINKFGIPSYKRSVPLDAEAADIGRMLDLSVNTISYVSIQDTPKSIYIPRDKMAPILQRPTQEQLNNERNTTSTASARQ